MTTRRRERWISDAGHAWLEVPIADLVASGVNPSRYSFYDSHTHMAYLEEDCDAPRYLDKTYFQPITRTAFGKKIAVPDWMIDDPDIEDEHVEYPAFVRELQRFPVN
jgi:hypothetical protein